MTKKASTKLQLKNGGMRDQEGKGEKMSESQQWGKIHQEEFLRIKQQEEDQQDGGSMS